MSSRPSGDEVFAGTISDGGSIELAVTRTAAATCGVAMGVMGTDVAIETADVTLMADDLTKLAWLIRHSRRALAVIKQNIGFALGLKAGFLPLTFAGLATLWMAILADMGASLLVIFNRLRLLKRTGPPAGGAAR